MRQRHMSFEVTPRRAEAWRSCMKEEEPVEENPLQIAKDNVANAEDAVMGDMTVQANIDIAQGTIDDAYQAVNDLPDGSDKSQMITELLLRAERSGNSSG